MKYRCGNPACKTEEFTSDVPVCPACKVDGRNPRYAQLVVELATIHFDPPDPMAPKSMGQNVLACDPSKPIYGFRASGSHAVVNCEKCRETKAFKDSYSPPLGQEPVDDAVVSMEKGRIKYTEPKG